MKLVTLRGPLCFPRRMSSSGPDDSILLTLLPLGQTFQSPFSFLLQHISLVLDPILFSVWLHPGHSPSFMSGCITHSQTSIPDLTYLRLHQLNTSTCTSSRIFSLPITRWKSAVVPTLLLLLCTFCLVKGPLFVFLVLFGHLGWKPPLTSLHIWFVAKSHCFYLKQISHLPSPLPVPMLVMPGIEPLLPLENPNAFWLPHTYTLIIVLCQIILYPTINWIALQQDYDQDTTSLGWLAGWLACLLAFLLSVCLYVCLCICVSTYLCVCLCIFLCVYVSMYVFTYVLCLCMCLCIYVSMYLCIYVSVYYMSM